MSDPQTVGYNEMMNRWAQRQRLSWRLWHLWLRPTPYATPRQRFAGYVWRSFVVLGFIALGILQLAKWKAERSGYADGVADALGEKIGAYYAVANPLQVAGSEMVIPRFQALAKEGAPWKSVELLNARFQKPFFFGFHQTDWQVGQPRINSIKLALADGEENDLLKNKGLAPLQAPQIRFDVEHAEATKFQATWGKMHWGNGSIENSRLQYERKNGKHLLELTGGSLSQNWLTGLTLEQLKGEIQGDQLKINQAALQFGEDNGKGTLSGTVQGTSELMADLQLKLEGVNVKTWLPEEVAEHIHGTLEGELIFKGAMAPSKPGAPVGGPLPRHFAGDKAGMLISGVLNLNGGEIEGIEYLNNLANYLGHLTVKRPPITSATLSLQSQAGAFILDKIVIKSGEDVMITGRVEYVDGNVGGELQIGIRSEFFKKIPELLVTHFKEAKDGYQWQKVALMGKPDTATHDDAVELGKRYLEIQKGRSKK